MDYFIVPDVHGNHELVRGLLASQGLPRDDVTVVQLGDLANCVRGSIMDDLKALDMVGTDIDLMLLGNHEAPYMFDRARVQIQFAGFHWYDEVRESLDRILDAGLLRLCICVHGVLVTHAGLSSYWGRPDTSPGEAEGWLNHLWASGSWRDEGVVTAIGRSRGGWHAEGGILWSDWNEPKRSIPQLMGHTVGDDIRHKGQSVCIDLGAGKRSTRIAGAWIRHGGDIETVIHWSDA